MTQAALLVIDIQRGAFDGVRCPPIDRAEDLLRNARRLVDAARNSGTPVIFVQHCDGKGAPFEEGTPHWMFHDQVTPWAGDVVITKSASSAFEKTALADELSALRVTDLVVCGLQSEVCVSNTSKSALTAGYRVTVVADGHGTWPSEGRTSQVIAEAVNRELRSLGAVVQSTEDVARTMRGRLQSLGHDSAEAR